MEAVHREFMGHPKGLFVLFFTEMWERFSYYGMRAILVLYLVAQTQDGGLGWTNAEALSLYGWYTMLVYLASVPGGIIADRFIGQKKSVMYGGLLLVAGHSLMAYTEMWAFYGALGLIIAGVGLLKPNVSTMVGELYSQEDKRRDSAFTIFYMGINIGAFLSALIVGYVAEAIGWHYGFAIAGVGMALGQLVYWKGQKYLIGAGEHHARNRPANEAHEKTPLTKQERDRLLLLGISFLIVIVFWACFEQAGGYLNLYTDQLTNRDLFGFEVPASWFQSLNPLFIIMFGGVCASLWIMLAKKGKAVSSLFKMSLGTAVMGLGFLLMVAAAVEKNTSSSGLSSMHWLVGAYLFHTIGELFLSPVALSYVTKLAPKRMVASMMGIYFFTTGIANKLAAQLGALSESFGDFGTFALIAGIAIGAGCLLMIFSPFLQKLAHGADASAHDIKATEPGQQVA